eukprot:5576836-Pleurochrysis_carterae.AAC.2
MTPSPPHQLPSRKLAPRARDKAGAASVKRPLAIKRQRCPPVPPPTLAPEPNRPYARERAGKRARKEGDRARVREYESTRNHGSLGA